MRDIKFAVELLSLTDLKSEDYEDALEEAYYLGAERGYASGFDFGYEQGYMKGKQDARE